MKKIVEETMELVYNLICDFIKLRVELSHHKITDTSGVVRDDSW